MAEPFGGAAFTFAAAFVANGTAAAQGIPGQKGKKSKECEALS